VISLVFREQAQEDIYSLYAYFASIGTEKEEFFTECLNKTFKKLLMFPKVGKVYNFKRTEIEIRFFPVEGFHDFYIFYFVESEMITVARVLHSKMDFKAIFEEGETT